MEYFRYGKFKFSDYYVSFLVIVALLVFAISSILLNLPFFYVVIPVFYALIRLSFIIMPHLERFSIHNKSIIVSKWGKKSYTIGLPEELTIVISYVDISPPLAGRNGIGNTTHTLNKRYAVSIMHKMSLETVLGELHKSYIKRHTTSTIKMIFDGYRYIYGFVCNQVLFDELIANRKCLIIIPESLLEKVSVDSGAVEMYIEKGY